jgi:hypothetical protein
MEDFEEMRQWINSITWTKIQSPKSDTIDKDEKVEQLMKSFNNLFNFFVNLLCYIKAMCVHLVICKFGKFIMFDDG